MFEGVDSVPVIIMTSLCAAVAAAAAVSVMQVGVC